VDCEVAVEAIGECSIKAVGRVSVDGPWMDRFILVDDPLMLRFDNGLSGPCIEKDGEGKGIGL
jgi:hypothetical protein